MKRFFGFVFLIMWVAVRAQEIPYNGLKPSKPTYVLLKNAKIYASADKVYQQGSILIRDGKIEAIGLIINPPAEAIILDFSDKVILPAFIELNSDLGIPPAAKKNNSGRDYPQVDRPEKGPYYWNESIHPEMRASDSYQRNEEKAKEYLHKGFAYVLTCNKDGIARGQAALISLDQQHKDLSHLTNTSLFSFQKGSSAQSYPSSQMGAIALLRQAFHDAEYYEKNKQELNLSLESLNRQRNQKMIFESREKYEILRAAKVASEFGFSFHYIGSGDEYQIVDLLKEGNHSVTVPLDFPKAYEVSDPYIARQIPLSDLKHWELAPRNPSSLVKGGVSTSLSSINLDKSTFWKNLRLAIQAGLSQEEALRALTENPARVLGIDKELGTLEMGKLASFCVYDTNPLSEEATLLESWISGEQTIIQSAPIHDVRGKYNLNIGNLRFPIEIGGKSEALTGKLTYKHPLANGGTKDSTLNMKVVLTQNDLVLQVMMPDGELKGSLSLKGKVNTKLGVFEGEGLLPDGRWVNWNAIKNTPFKEVKEPTNTPAADSSGRSWYPNMAYGFQRLPEAENIVINNATVWTNETDGILSNAMVVIRNGKIAYVGTGKPAIPAGARIIDGTGLHVTCGIIDEHSHIAIAKGVNEGGQAISSEVSIGDVIDPDDINIYRQLAGGVTCSQLLHGSANPIGGQSALIKLKWGHSPNEMLVDNAPKFIKFALGENVKQSNWGDYNSVRFPQTRMGVEQVYVDGFNRAKAYMRSWENYAKNPTVKKPAKDLELEVIAEILRGERHITCHSYVQSEINMLMHVADSFGIKINTFTHILEGYKLADKMLEHGAGGSTFSDWWAYKFEVNDAIPYNAKMMHDQGVVVAINSDDAEMGRRLNQEAAKAVKYGGMSEEDAWKLVTLNPAKLLHVDDRMGSLREGKDADVVIWSNHPLSVHAKAMYTIVEGKVLFDHERDQLLQKYNQTEKARILTKMQQDNKGGNPSRSYGRKKSGAYHCDTLGEDKTTEENHH